MNDDLEQMTDAQLNELFAVEACGWRALRMQPNRAYGHMFLYGSPPDVSHGMRRRVPDYCASADAALPYLEQWRAAALTARGVEANLHNNCGTAWFVELTSDHCDSVLGTGPTLARAAVIALLRAHRATKESSP